MAEEQRTGGSTLLSTIVRQPFSIIGALGLISLLGDVIELPKNLKLIVTAYQSITQPIWDILLGWLFRWIGWDFPWWVKDYLTMGIIVYAATLRSGTLQFEDLLQRRQNGYHIKDIAGAVIKFFTGILAWPVLLFLGLGALFFARTWLDTTLNDFFSNYGRITLDEDRARQRWRAHEARLEEKYRDQLEDGPSLLQLKKIATPEEWQMREELEAAVVSEIRNRPKISARIFAEFIYWSFFILAVSYGLFFYWG